MFLFVRLVNGYTLITSKLSLATVTAAHRVKINMLPRPQAANSVPLKRAKSPPRGCSPSSGWVRKKCLLVNNKSYLFVWVTKQFSFMRTSIIGPNFLKRMFWKIRAYVISKYSGFFIFENCVFF